MEKICVLQNEVNDLKKELSPAIKFFKSPIIVAPAVVKKMTPKQAREKRSDDRAQAQTLKLLSELNQNNQL